MNDEYGKLKANYQIACLTCGQKPTVAIVYDTKKDTQTKLCGPCYFGSADCVDPDQWES